ncbi:ABC transporter G family member 39 [Iris pallida]|uniref:ABC transporter G family member 39 n=1 Tax=Iris pallida TaxID=29817 RepID=A0AAX6I244_IRIPA|nr:ABC transporter G family member 39 [Iris pallida]
MLQRHALMDINSQTPKFDQEAPNSLLAMAKDSGTIWYDLLKCQEEADLLNSLSSALCICSDYHLQVHRLQPHRLRMEVDQVLLEHLHHVLHLPRSDSRTICLSQGSGLRR